MEVSHLFPGDSSQACVRLTETNRQGFLKNLNTRRLQRRLVSTLYHSALQQEPRRGSALPSQVQASHGSFLILLLSYHLLFSRVSSLAWLAAAVLRSPHASPRSPLVCHFSLQDGRQQDDPQERGGLGLCQVSPITSSAHCQEAAAGPPKLRTDPRASLFPCLLLVVLL